MVRIEKQLHMAENMYAKKKSIKISIIIIFFKWLSYKLNKNSSDLNKAYYLAVVCYNENKPFVPLILILSFLEIELKNFERAEDLLDTFAPYKNYYKVNDPIIYALFVYLTGLIFIRMDKPRQSKKSIKILNELIKENEHFYYYMFLGSLEKEQNEFSSSYKHFASSYAMGCRSFFLFMNLYELFINNSQDIEDTHGLSAFVLLWDKANTATFDNKLTMNKDRITAVISISQAKRLYAKHPNTWLLAFIYTGLTTKFDYSKKAYAYYKEAELKQLDLPDLDKHLVRAAFFNHIENISHYSMEKFLTRNESDDALKAFVFHLLITDKNLHDLAQIHTNEILQLAIYSLDNEKKGRYYNSIYKFFIEKASEFKGYESYYSKCEKFIKEDLFYYKASITNKNIHCVIVFEKEKKSSSKFYVFGRNIKVKAATDQFNYICLDESEKTIIDEKLIFTKLVANADFFLYQHFFKNSFLEPDIIIALAKLYISVQDKTIEGVYVLNAALSLKNISINFRMILSATLGNILAAQNRFDKALEYYNKVDENYLSDKYIELMLTAFVNAKEFEKAVKLVVKKSHCITDRTLVFCLKQISTVKIYNGRLANIAYELILKSWYDKNLIDMIIKHYNGGQEEWQELSRVLSNIQVYELEIDEKIISNSIWMHKFDEYSQRVFVRMYEMDKENKLISDFAYYMIYEIIINDVKPIYECIEILEKLFIANQEKLYAYALFTLYLEKSIVTFLSDDIIKKAILFMEEDKILLPSVNKLKDKNMISAYILKNQPFIYRSLPNRNIYVYYQTETLEKTYVQKMTYFRFGLYLAIIPIFYGEKINYYYSEELSTGSITTKPAEITNNKLNISEILEDDFFTTNNALIYEYMFKYDQVENIITETLSNTHNIKGKLM